MCSTCLHFDVEQPPYIESINCCCVKDSMECVFFPVNLKECDNCSGFAVYWCASACIGECVG